MSKTIRNCDNCGKEYAADNRNLKRGWGNCCDKSCAAKLREKKATGYNSQNNADTAAIPMNHKEKVLKVYPDAEIRKTKNGYLIFNNSVQISNSCFDQAWESAYRNMQPTTTTITVTGCWGCLLFTCDGDGWKHCNHPENKISDQFPNVDVLFATCPLKTSPITIMLKK